MDKSKLLDRIGALDEARVRMDVKVSTAKF